MANGPTIEDVIERVRLFRGREVTASPLSGGHMNAVFLVQADDVKYVVRVPGPSSELLVPNRANERHNSEAAAAAGVSPRVREYLDDWNVMVLDYVEGETLSSDTLGLPGQIPRVAASLRRLHAGPRFLTNFDMFSTTQCWLRVCDERQIAVPDGLRDRMGRVREAERALAARPMPLVPCHNDLSADNFIDDGRQLWIVDFEYSGNNDPCYDLGDVANQSDLDQDWRARLCEVYFGEATPELLARMNLHALIANVGLSLWCAIQSGISTIDFDFAGVTAAFWNDAVALLDSEEFPHLLLDASREAGAS